MSSSQIISFRASGDFLSFLESKQLAEESVSLTASRLLKALIDSDLESRLSLLDRRVAKIEAALVQGVDQLYSFVGDIPIVASELPSSDDDFSSVAEVALSVYETMYQVPGCADVFPGGTDSFDFDTVQGEVVRLQGELVRLQGEVVTVQADNEQWQQNYEKVKADYIKLEHELQEFRSQIGLLSGLASDFFGSFVSTAAPLLLNKLRSANPKLLTLSDLQAMLSSVFDDSSIKKFVLQLFNTISSPATLDKSPATCDRGM